MLNVEGLTVSYSGDKIDGGWRTVVDHVNLSVRSGEIVGLVGESGCGKSTLARAIIGLQSVDGGTVLLDGADVHKMSPRRFRSHRRLAQMVFQNPYSSLDPHRTIGAAIAEALAICGSCGRGHREHRVGELLGMVGLDPAVRTRRPRQLSGGQCQRVVIARALAAAPRLLVCDEPVTALDVSAQARVLNLLMDMRDELGMACLFITHDLSVLAQLADRVVVMDRGRLVEEGATYEVLDHPQHVQTQRLLNAVPRFSTQGFVPV